MERPESEWKLNPYYENLMTRKELEFDPIEKDHIQYFKNFNRTKELEDIRYQFVK